MGTLESYTQGSQAFACFRITWGSCSIDTCQGLTPRNSDFVDLGWNHGSAFEQVRQVIAQNGPYTTLWEILTQAELLLLGMNRLQPVVVK